MGLLDLYSRLEEYGGWGLGCGRGVGLLPHPLFLGFFWVVISPSLSVSAVTWLCSAQSPFILTLPSPLSLSCLVSLSLSLSLCLCPHHLCFPLSPPLLLKPRMVTWAPPLSSPLPPRPGAAAAERREAAADGAGTGGAAAGGTAAAAAPAGARGGAEPAAAQPRSVGGLAEASRALQDTVPSLIPGHHRPLSPAPSSPAGHRLGELECPWEKAKLCLLPHSPPHEHHSTNPWLNEPSKSHPLTSVCLGEGPTVAPTND